MGGRRDLLKVISPKTAAAHLGISADRVRKLIATKALHAVNIGLDRPVWAIEESELARFATLTRPGHRPRKEPKMFYAIAHHGTAGLGASYGYAEVIEGDAPRSDQTTTVTGPFATKQEAQADADAMDRECDTFRQSQDR